MAPSSYHPMDAHGRSGGAGAMISTAPASAMRESANGLGGVVADARKRKIDEVDGHQQEDRVRLGMQFSHEGGGGSSSSSMIIEPTSYRAYSDFPRSSYPSQMPAPATAGQLSQVRRSEEENPSTTVRVAVEAPMLAFPGCFHSLSSVSRDEVEVVKEGHGHRPMRDRVRSLGWRSRLTETLGELVSFLSTPKSI